MADAPQPKTVRYKSRIIHNRQRKLVTIKAELAEDVDSDWIYEVTLRPIAKDPLSD